MWHVEFNDEIDVMKSLAHPKKISILGSDGATYKFLGKPKDDLRKDARLMDFNAIINKFLKSDSECRRRQLRASRVSSDPPHRHSSYSPLSPRCSLPLAPA